MNEKIPVQSISQTAGLTSPQQLVDSTSNKFFKLVDSTSATESILYSTKE